MTTLNSPTRSTGTETPRAQTPTITFGDGLPPVQLPQTVTTQGVAPAYALPTHLTVGEKPEKFDGTGYKMWQAKMQFYLTTLKLARYITGEASAITLGVNGDVHTVAWVDTWNQGDYLCRNYILNNLVDQMYTVYYVFKTSRDLWRSLEKKYKIEDAGAKKFVVGKFLDFKMVDSKTVVNQIQDLQVILHDIAAEGMTLCEPFQVVAFIEKLPPGWRD